MSRIINRTPDRGTVFILGVLPFAVLLIVYLLASGARLSENADDKLLPSLASLGEAIVQVAVHEDRRTGHVLLWADTLASLRRLGIGVGLAALAGLGFGVLVGAVPYARALLTPLITALSLVPPLAVLPILFIVFGLDELSKIVLIVIGIAPVIMRDIAQRVGEIPAEQIIKAQTLGASSWQTVVRVIVPQVMPRLVDSVRLALGAAWLFLIAAEAIAATQGLGYRIFLVRRYLAMDLILPYVVWITLLAYVLDRLLLAASRRLYPWYHVEARP